MRAFTVTDKYAKVGIVLSDKPYPCVEVGEEGRGRILARVAVARAFFDSLVASAKKAFKRAAVLRLADGTIVLDDERNHEDQRALVLVQIPAGFRGGTEWNAAEYRMVPCEGGQRTWDYKCSKCGEPWEENKPHPEGNTLQRWEPFPPEGIKVIAEGQCAEGDAGAMGNHTEKLLIMEPGSMFRVRRDGRLYGEPRKRYVRWTGETLQLCSWDELFPPSERIQEVVEEV